MPRALEIDTPDSNTIDQLRNMISAESHLTQHCCDAIHHSNFGRKKKYAIVEHFEIFLDTHDG